MAYPANLIRRAVQAGATIFDGEILHVTGLEFTETAIDKVMLRSCNYFAYASLSLRLQTALRSKWRRSVAHSQHLDSFKTAITNPLQPQTLGCMCATLFEEKGEILIAIAHRSSRVLNGSNVMAVLPNFGVESNMVGGRRSKYNVLFYNFLREFAEEFYNLEDLVEVAKSRRAHPDWILGLPSVEAVVREAVRGRLIMVTGQVAEIVVV